MQKFSYRAESVSPAGGFPSAPHSLTTLIRFSVSVPVLSEQITLTAPAVSVAMSFLISTFSRARRIILSASETATMAGSPSGTDATTRTMPVMNTSASDSKLACPPAISRAADTAMTSAAATPPTMVTVFVSFASF